MTKTVEKYEEFLDLKKKNIKVEKEDNEDNETETEEKIKIGYLNNIMFENKLLNECGLGLSEEESYLLKISMIKFSKKYNTKKTIFWGKIYGIENNYYIIEAENENLEIEIKDLEVIELNYLGSK